MLIASPKLLAKEMLLTKAYPQPDGSVAIEGWISTPLQDMEKDILEPEAFAGEGFRSYFAHGAPISSNHDTNSYPVGYLQKGVLVRNGVVIQSETHPDHEGVQFKNFDGFGTGWYGRGIIYEKRAADHLMKGTVRSFSWIGMPKEWEDLPGGGRRFSKQGAINPLLEVTITAYPINQAAMLRIAKAHGVAGEASKSKTKPKQLFILDLEAVVAAAFSSQRTNEVIAADVKNAFSDTFDVRLKGHENA